MPKKPRTNLIKNRRSYTLQEIAELLGVNIKTCSRWLKKGLKPIFPNKKPILVMGSDLKYFLIQSNQKNKVKLKKNEYYCLKCRKGVKARADTERTIKTGQRIGKENREQMKKIGLCEHCQKQINKFI